MILKEIPLKTFDDELMALIGVKRCAVNIDAVFGAILAIRWLRNGGIPPSVKLAMTADATAETN